MPDAGRRLVALLEAEGRALARGDVHAAADLSARKARLATRLERQAGTDHAAELHALAARNARLLRAALDGLAAARRRLASADAPLETYDGRGQSRPLAARSGTVSRKA